MEQLGEHNTKRELLKKSAEQRAALEDKLHMLSDKTEKVITNALVIGGALAVSYLIARQFFKKKSVKPKIKKRNKNHIDSAYSDMELVEERSPFSEALSEVGTVVASQLLAFLLSMAKEKLQDYLSTEQAEKKTEE